MTDESEPMPLQPIWSNVPGLDGVLNGGFFRGGIYILGAHSFEITNAGISVHPRTGAQLGTRAPPTESRQLLDVGIKSLDEMLAGGLFAG